MGEILTKRGDVPETTDDFPLMLITRRSNDFYNSTGRHNPRLTGHQPYNPAFLSPIDLAHFDIEDGDIVRVSSAHGEVVAVAAIDARLLPGTLSMSHCFGTNPDEDHDPLMQGSCTSALMDANAEFDPLFGQPRMSALPVGVTLISRCAELVN